LASPWRVLKAYPLTEEEKHLLVVPNFSWMIENRLAGVSYPRSEDAIALLRKLGVLALLTLDGFLAQGLPVAVHCGAGLGRTGTILACYLVSQGSTAKEATQQVRTKRPGSIETLAQEAVVEAYGQVRQEKQSA
jgi:protein tyrosine/serine phosphatase